MIDTTTKAKIRREAEELERQWATDPRWRGIERPYSGEDVVRLRGSVRVEHTVARLGAERLWKMLGDAGLHRGARCHDGRSGGRDAEGRSRGDLPVRLAGGGRRQPLRADVSRTSPSIRRTPSRRSSAG